MVAVKRAMDVVGADVGDGHDVEVAGSNGAQEHVALVAGSDDADAERIGDRALIAEIHRPQARAGNRPGGDARFQEIAAVDADGALKVALADGLFIRTEIHRTCLSSSDERAIELESNRALPSGRPPWWPAQPGRTFQHTLCTWARRPRPKRVASS